jgi:hypothetical protein
VRFCLTTSAPHHSHFRTCIRAKEEEEEVVVVEREREREREREGGMRKRDMGLFVNSRLSHPAQLFCCC